MNLWLIELICHGGLGRMYGGWLGDVRKPPGIGVFRTDHLVLQLDIGCWGKQPHRLVHSGELRKFILGIVRIREFRWYLLLVHWGESPPILRIVVADYIWMAVVCKDLSTRFCVKGKKGFYLAWLIVRCREINKRHEVWLLHMGIETPRSCVIWLSQSYISCLISTISSQFREKPMPFAEIINFFHACDSWLTSRQQASV